MSAPAPKKATLGEQWRLVQEMLDQAEIERLGAMTPEQIEEEARSDGIGEARARELLRRAVERADQVPVSKVVDLAAARQRRRGRAGMIATTLALAAGVLATIGYVERGPIASQWQAWFHPAPSPTQQPGPPLVPPTHQETPLEKARRLREQAYVNVQKGYYKDAADELNEAAEIDPAGNADPRVAQARYDIAVGDPKRVPSSKVGPDYWESPLPHVPRPIQR